MRKHLIWIVGVAVAVLASSVALAATATQHVSYSVSPKKLSKKGKGSPIKVHIRVFLDPQNGSDTPATDVKLMSGKYVTINTKGIKQCPVSSITNLSDAAARAACPRAIIGGGSAVAYLGSTQIPTTVTAFNGTPVGGKPTLILHSTSTTPLPSSIDIVGQWSKKTGGTVDFPVPPLAGGAAVLTEFTTDITKKGYYNAKCPPSKKLTLNSSFTFKDGSVQTPSSTTPCKSKK